MLKLFRDDLGLGAAGENDQPMSRHIPYLRHVSDTVIRLENGALMSVIKLSGLFFQTEDGTQINMRNAVQNTVIRGLGSSRFSLWSTIIRREIKPEIGGSFEAPFCALLNDRYMEQLRRKRMFQNDLYFTIVRSGLRGPMGLGDVLRKAAKSWGGAEIRAQHDREEVSEFEELVGNVVKQLHGYGARILGIVERDGDPYSEPSEFLHTILSGGVQREMRLPRMSLKNYIGSKRLFFGNRALQIQGGSEEEQRFGAMLAIKEYPPYSAPGMLDGLLQVNHEFILTQSFTLSDKPIAQERITRLQRQIQASDEAGTSVESNINGALDSLLNQEAVFGTHHFTLMCLSRDYADLTRVISDLGSCLTDMNINWLREDLNAEASFWAQLPGNHGYIARTGMLSSANFAGFSSMHNFASGSADKTHWGSPITILETTSQTPYTFNFHNERGVGHFLVTGPSGSGKTVALSFLLAQAFRVSPAPRAVFFDKDRGAEIFIRALGGQYEILEPGNPTGFNPLQIENNGPNREFLIRLLTVMLTTGKAALTQEEEDSLERAVVRLMGEPVSDRNLASLSALLAGGSAAHANDLPSRLRPWISGEKAWLFNSPRDVLSFGGQTVFGFDMTSILSVEDMRTPALMYLYHRLDELLTGEPVMFFMDEGWQLLQDETFSAYIIDKMKTIRKLNGIVGFGTQSAADIAKAKASHTLIEQSPTHIHFPNPRADEESYRGRFNLTAKEFKFIKETPPERRSFLVKHGTDSVIARLDLSSMPDLIRVLSGTKTSVDECAALRERLGDAPEHWLGEFCGWENADEG